MAHIATTREMQSCRPLAAHYASFLYTVRMAMLGHQAERQRQEQATENKRLHDGLTDHGRKWWEGETFDDKATYQPPTEDDFLYPDQNEENDD